MVCDIMVCTRKNNVQACTYCSVITWVYRADITLLQPSHKFLCIAAGPALPKLILHVAAGTSLAIRLLKLDPLGNATSHLACAPSMDYCTLHHQKAASSRLASLLRLDSFQWICP